MLEGVKGGLLVVCAKQMVRLYSFLKLYLVMVFVREKELCSKSSNTGDTLLCG